MMERYPVFKFRPEVSLDTYRALWRNTLKAAEGHFKVLQQPRSVDQIVSYLDELNDFEVLINGSDIAGSLWKAIHPSTAIRDEAEKAAKAFVALKSEMLVSMGIAGNLTLLERAATPKDVDAVRLLDVWRRNLRQGGAYLKPEVKEEARCLTLAIQEAMDEYRNNMRQDRQHLELTASELYGVPEDYLISRPINAKTGKVHIINSRSDVGPVLDFCQNQATREKVFRMSNNQASPANEAVLARLLNSRQKKAALLGYKNWAQMQLEGTMAKETKVVSRFLDDMYQVVKPRAKKEIQAISKLLKEQDDIDAQVWDVQYGISRLKSHLSPGFDSKEMRQYFLVDKALPALRTIVQDMFCLRFEETDIRAWHPSVTSCLVYDKSRNEEVLIGRLFFDVSSREGKIDGASALTIRSAVCDKQLAEVVLVASLQSHPGACMSMLEVKSIFHELGHCVHALVGKQRYCRLSGTATQRDFVEAPSQMLELVFTGKEIFDFAVNAEGQRIPDEMLDKLLASADVGQGLREVNTLVLAHYSVGNW